MFGVRLGSAATAGAIVFPPMGKNRSRWLLCHSNVLHCMHVLLF